MWFKYESEWKLCFSFLSSPLSLTHLEHNKPVLPLGRWSCRGICPWTNMHTSSIQDITITLSCPYIPSYRENEPRIYQPHSTNLSALYILNTAKMVKQESKWMRLRVGNRSPIQYWWPPECTHNRKSSLELLPAFAPYGTGLRVDWHASYTHFV